LKSQVNAEQYRKFPLIEDGLVRRIRMDTLAALGAYSINEPISYIKNQMERAYSDLQEPDTTQFSSITAGVSHRRWIMTANTPLSGMISELIGHEWITSPEQLHKLKDHMEDEELLFKFNDLRLIAKQRLAGKIAKQTGVSIDPSSMFDVHTTRINLYKRQLLQLFHILYVYCRVKDGETPPAQKRVHVFSGKAAHTDYLAKQILMLINLTAELVNKDPQLDDIIKVIFISDFSISWASELIPATDIYESLGLPGVENSPTTCLKYAFNGALLVGSKTRTLNEVEKKIGSEHLFLFGNACKKDSKKDEYSPAELIKNSPTLKRIVETIEQHLCKKAHNDFMKPLLASFKDTDDAYVMYDFDDYLQTQARIDTLFSDSAQWASKCLGTIAEFGHFSTDRVIGEYASRLWRIPEYE
jgi:starch phosphorylase